MLTKNCPNGSTGNKALYIWVPKLLKKQASISSHEECSSQVHWLGHSPLHNKWIPWDRLNDMARAEADLLPYNESAHAQRIRLMGSTATQLPPASPPLPPQLPPHIPTQDQDKNHNTNTHREQQRHKTRTTQGNTQVSTRHSTRTRAPRKERD